MSQIITGLMVMHSKNVMHRDDIKADVWSLGCSLYEMATLQIPFDANNLDALVKVICTKEIDPLPNHLDPKIKMMIYSMLQKDKRKRPSIWDLAELEFIKERIIDFAKKNEYLETVEALFEYG